MSIPDTTIEMKVTPIPKRLLELFNDSPVDQKLNEWLTIRCFIGRPTKPEALAFIKRQVSNNTKCRIPENVLKAAGVEK